MPQDSEDMINFTRGIDGVEVGLFFMEQPRGGTKISLRSRQLVDVARIAESFGGGGHRAAAGATVPGSMTEIVERVRKAVRAHAAPAAQNAMPGGRPASRATRRGSARPIFVPSRGAMSCSRSRC